MADKLPPSIQKIIDEKWGNAADFSREALDPQERMETAIRNLQVTRVACELVMSAGFGNVPSKKHDGDEDPLPVSTDTSGPRPIPGGNDSTALRLPLPMAYADPAFSACIAVALDTPELITQFDRLYGARLMSGKPSGADMRGFVGFVHRCMYMALPDESIHSMRMKAVSSAHSATPP